MDSGQFLKLFQSTLSVRRATGTCLIEITSIMISIHALRKESDSCHCSWHGWVTISIHALRKESDKSRVVNIDPQFTISIHALRKESDLDGRGAEVAAQPISIHALRKESDSRGTQPRHSYRHFNPRSP